MDTDTEALDQAPAATAPDAAPAPDAPPASGSSSPAADDPASPQGQSKADDQPKSALEAVLRAESKRRADEEVKAAPATEKPQGDPATAQPAAEADAGGEDGERIPDEVYKALPPIVKKRFGFLTRQNNERRDKLRSLEPVVQRDGQLQGFLEQHAIPQGEFSWLMQFAALVKTDPGKAYQHVAPLVRSLQEHVGEVLPEDLRAEVDAGTLSEARARELAATRNAKAVADANIARTTEVQRTRETQEAFSRHVADVSAAVTGWENQWKGSDPDFAVKQPFVWPELQMLLTEEQRANGGQPVPKAKVLELASQARKNIEARLAGIRPAPRAKNTVTGGAAVLTTKEPKNALEAAQLGLARARQAA